MKCRMLFYYSRTRYNKGHRSTTVKTILFWRKRFFFNKVTCNDISQQRLQDTRETDMTIVPSVVSLPFPVYHRYVSSFPGNLPVRLSCLKVVPQVLLSSQLVPPTGVDKFHMLAAKYCFIN